MSDRFIRPDTTRLELSEGDWLIVKNRLNFGEQRAAYARAYQTAADGTLHMKPYAMGMEMVVAYLLDWSLTDHDGRPVVIRGLSADEVTSILNNLSPEDFVELKEAIERHEAAMLAARTQEKKRPAGGTAAATTSSSPSAAAGASSGFAH
jgi:hypothetical protein